MEARVKQDYRFGTVSALVGRRFNKKDWTPIPAELEAEAEVHPFLEIRGKKVTPVPAEEPIKQATIMREDEAFPFATQTKASAPASPALAKAESAETLAAQKGVKLTKATVPGSKK